MRINTDIKRFLVQVRPYSGIIYFTAVLVVAHFLWKFSVSGDKSDEMVTLFGADISAVFRVMVRHITQVCSGLINLFGVQSSIVDKNVIAFYNGNAVRIIWGCTAIKQTFIFCCIIALTRGKWLQKLWYIPAGMGVMYLFNIFRISVIAIITKFRPEWFHFAHEIFFKLLFYFVIFLLWVLWEERFVKKKSSAK